MIIAGSSLQVKEDGEREAQKSLKRLQARPPWFLAVKQSTWGIQLTILYAKCDWK